MGRGRAWAAVRDDATARRVLLVLIDAVHAEPHVLVHVEYYVFTIFLLMATFQKVMGMVPQ